MKSVLNAKHRIETKNNDFDTLENVIPKRDGFLIELNIFGFQNLAGDGTFILPAI